MHFRKVDGCNDENEKWERNIKSQMVRYHAEKIWTVENLESTGDVKVNMKGTTYIKETGENDGNEEEKGGNEAEGVGNEEEEGSGRNDEQIKVV